VQNKYNCLYVLIIYLAYINCFILVLVTYKSPGPGVDGTTLVPSLWFTLPIETHVYNNTIGPPSEENSTDVVPSLTTISILDSVEAGKNVPLVVPRYVEGKTPYLKICLNS